MRPTFHRVEDLATAAERYRLEEQERERARYQELHEQHSRDPSGAMLPGALALIQGLVLFPPRRMHNVPWATYLEVAGSEYVLTLLGIALGDISAYVRVVCSHWWLRSIDAIPDFAPAGMCQLQLAVGEVTRFVDRFPTNRLAVQMAPFVDTVRNEARQIKLRQLLVCLPQQDDLLYRVAIVGPGASHSWHLEGTALAYNDIPMQIIGTWQGTYEATIRFQSWERLHCTSLLELEQTFCKLRAKPDYVSARLVTCGFLAPPNAI
jgi:hypothetical protein